MGSREEARSRPVGQPAFSRKPVTPCGGGFLLCTGAVVSPSPHLSPLFSFSGDRFCHVSPYWTALTYPGQKGNDKDAERVRMGRSFENYVVASPGDVVVVSGPSGDIVEGRSLNIVVSRETCRRFVFRVEDGADEGVNRRQPCNSGVSREACPGVKLRAYCGVNSGSRGRRKQVYGPGQHSGAAR